VAGSTFAKRTRRDLEWAHLLRVWMSFAIDMAVSCPFNLAGAPFAERHPIADLQQLD